MMTHFNKQLKSKMHAFGVHFALSLLLFIVTVFWLYLSLYPSIHFSINGGWQGVRLIFAIDLILGPALTFLVWNPKKSLKEKILDLSVVGTIQVTALAYGIYTVYQQHPVLIQVLQGGSASTISYEQYQKELPNADLSALKLITSLPVAFYAGVNKENYGIVPLEYIPQRVIDNDKAIRKSLSMQQKEEIERIVSLSPQKNTYLFELVGRYKKIIILLNQDFSFIGHTSPYEI